MLVLARSRSHLAAATSRPAAAAGAAQALQQQLQESSATGLSRRWMATGRGGGGGGGEECVHSAVREMNDEFAAVFGEPAPLSHSSSAPRAPSTSSPPLIDDPFLVAPPPPSSPSPTPSFSHVDAHGRAAMVDVSAKSAASLRRAVASARVLLGKAAFDKVAANSVEKGDVLTVARLAGVMGAKATSTLIPLCHNIPLAQVSVDLSLDDTNNAVKISAEARAVGPTGVEMEAMTAASTAALTVYDMCKGIEKGIVIENVRLESKIGGKSGDWARDE